MQPTSSSFRMHQKNRLENFSSRKCPTNIGAMHMSQQQQGQKQQGSMSCVVMEESNRSYTTQEPDDTTKAVAKPESIFQISFHFPQRPTLSSASFHSCFSLKDFKRRKSFGYYFYARGEQDGNRTGTRSAPLLLKGLLLSQKNILIPLRMGSIRRVVLFSSHLT